MQLNTAFSPLRRGSWHKQFTRYTLELVEILDKKLIFRFLLEKVSVSRIHSETVHTTRFHVCKHTVLFVQLDNGMHSETTNDIDLLH